MIQVGKIKRKLLEALLPRVTPFRGCNVCTARQRPLSDRLGNVGAINLQIDAVYTWVDGSDPAWCAKRDSYLSLDPALHSASLYRNNDELRYSLRSLELNAPWIRRIFIVTDNQSPKWLNINHPRISLIDHRDIIPHKYLPTFSSRVIEAFLHRIPELTEHYIYFNDDVFLSAPSKPEYFFTPNGLPYLFADWRRPRRKSYAKAATFHTRSYANVKAYLSRKGIRKVPALITAHGPFPQVKENAVKVFALFEEAINEFACERFRSFNGMVFYCHMAPIWSYISGRGVPLDLEYFYIDVKRPDRLLYYHALLEDKETPLFYCLNDTDTWGEASDWQKDMASFLSMRYPHPTEFEIQASPSL